jgi:hypothetical protein
MPLFQREKTLSELQEQDDRLDTELSIAKKRSMIKELEAKAGAGGWKMFSNDGTKRGISWGRVWDWLKKH